MRLFVPHRARRRFESPPSSPVLPRRAVPPSATTVDDGMAKTRRRFGPRPLRQPQSVGRHAIPALPPTPDEPAAHATSFLNRSARPAVGPPRNLDVALPPPPRPRQIDATLRRASTCRPGLVFRPHHISRNESWQRQPSQVKSRCLGPPLWIYALACSQTPFFFLSLTHRQYE